MLIVGIYCFSLFSVFLLTSIFLFIYVFLSVNIDDYFLFAQVVCFILVVNCLIIDNFLVRLECPWSVLISYLFLFIAVNLEFRFVRVPIEMKILIQV